MKQPACFWLSIITMEFWFCLIFIFILASPSPILAKSSSQYQTINQPGPLPFLQAAITPTLATQEIITETVLQTDTNTVQTSNTLAPIFQENSLSTSKFSFSELGYDEVTLNSPIGQTTYMFTLPNNQHLREGTSIALDLSYQYISFASEDNLPASFGQLIIKVNGQTARIYPIEEQNLTHHQLQVLVPPQAIEKNPNSLTVEITFDIGICDALHKAALVIHPASFFALSLTETPLIPDLSVYPLPFYQNSFETDIINFVLPTVPTTAETAAAISIAAKLGDLTKNRITISSTLDTGITDAISIAQTPPDQHLFIIGQPENNKTLTLLNQITDLPAKLQKREMELTTQGPKIISESQIFTYTFTITNTNPEVAVISLTNTLPTFTKFVDCIPDCTGSPNGSLVFWGDNVLTTNEVQNFSLTLQLTNTATNTTFIENTVILRNADLGDINVDTLASNIIGTNNSEENPSTLKNKSDYFFTINGKAIPENDGIIQEIISPWDENRAILIVTGLNADAIRKAGQALSSEVNFPGMDGSVALIQKITPPGIETSPLPASEVTFQDLGLSTQQTQGRFEQKINYQFPLPLNWQLTDQAFIEFFFNHAPPIDKNFNATMTLIFNRTPIGTIVLDEKTALDGRIKVNLPDSVALSGQINRLIVQITPPNIGGCDDGIADGFWFVAKNSSRLFLDHRQISEDFLNLSIYPYPFDNQSSLVDLLFALPEALTVNEWENTLGLAADLGSSAGGRAIIPTVNLGNSIFENDLTNYHIITIGPPLRNPLTQQINSNLPQPFLPNSNEIQQQIDNVVFRLPPDTDLGYLQIIQSPWNSQKAILAVTGTTNKGVSWAAQTLSAGKVKSSKPSNLALIQGENIETIDTHGLLKTGIARAIVTAVPILTSTTTISEVTPTPMPKIQETLSLTSTSEPNTSNTVTSSERPIWLIPLVVITAVVVLGIFGFVFIQSRRQH